MHVLFQIPCFILRPQVYQFYFYIIGHQNMTSIFKERWFFRMRMKSSFPKNIINRYHIVALYRGNFSNKHDHLFIGRELTYSLQHNPIRNLELKRNTQFHCNVESIQLLWLLAALADRSIVCEDQQS